MMFQLGNTIVSEDILTKEFACNLNACKGACCVQGEAGAPLNEDEIKILKKIFPTIKPFLREEGIKSIKEQGVFVRSGEHELETPLVDGKECAYTVFSAEGIAFCGIEKAYDSDVLAELAPGFRKPISCHLYPVRIQEYRSFTAVNYHRWPICNDACILGEKLSVPVYKFVKDALTRKFGFDWYIELEKIAENM